MATCSENVDSQTLENVSRIYIFTTAFGVEIDYIKAACLRLGKDPAVPPLLRNGARRQNSKIEN
jgi:hypothetical protein